jgi:2-dehydro-3-deoxyphosphooctonate aldolase (KDO 8-P synthase)
MRIIAGPCQHENLDHSIMIADHCAKICSKYDIDYYFKASFDKANRSSINGKRGTGFPQFIRDADEMKTEIPGLKILTDVHETQQVYAITAIDASIDVIQIPAFLCRQTNLIRAAADSGRIVNIKKGQFISPWEVKGILSKTEGAKEVWITERGTSFGYNTLVVDFTGLEYMLTNYNVPIVLDATHSVQKPGGNGTSSGGDRSYVPGLTRAASALGISNFFLEVHDDPDNAPSDGPNMIKLENFEEIIDDIHRYSYTR